MPFPKDSGTSSTYKNIKNIFILFLIFWLTLSLSSEKSVKQIQDKLIQNKLILSYIKSLLIVNNISEYKFRSQFRRVFLRIPDTVSVIITYLRHLCFSLSF